MRRAPRRGPRGRVRPDPPGRGVHGAAARAEAPDPEHAGPDRAIRVDDRRAPAGDRRVPLGRAARGAGRLDGGQADRRGAGRPGRVAGARPPRDRADQPATRRGLDLGAARGRRRAVPPPVVAPEDVHGRLSPAGPERRPRRRLAARRAARCHHRGLRADPGPADARHGVRADRADRVRRPAGRSRADGRDRGGRRPRARARDGGERAA